jgi:GNAT superfamily N-acetyltransferase
MRENLTSGLTRGAGASLPLLYLFPPGGGQTPRQLTACRSSGCYMDYIQDILVLPEYQNNGLGKVLMNEVLKKYRSVRQKVLLAQNEEYLDHFYTSIGFSDSKLQNCTAYVMQGS